MRASCLVTAMFLARKTEVHDGNNLVKPFTAVNLYALSSHYN